MCAWDAHKAAILLLSRNFRLLTGLDAADLSGLRFETGRISGSFGLVMERRIWLQKPISDR